jgi:hypothetical protein
MVPSTLEKENKNLSGVGLMVLHGVAVLLLVKK